jgi:hypothetical protein
MQFIEEIFNQRNQLKRGKKPLREFGTLFGFLFLGFSVLCLLKHRAEWHILLPASALMALAAWLKPDVLWHLYKPWMTLSFALGHAVSRIILILIFCFVITPTSLVLRLLGKDLLRMKKRAGGTYWIPRRDKPADVNQYGRMY